VSGEALEEERRRERGTSGVSEKYTERMIDFHNHLVPGVDDGASDLEQAVAALKAMHGEGIRTVVCTPHLRGRLTARPTALAERLAEIDAAWETLTAAASAPLPGVRLERGVELMLDTPSLDLSDPRLRLAGTSSVLVEFASMTVPPRSAEAVFELVMDGWQPIVAHPERYSGIVRMLEVAKKWRDTGARLQVNGGSLLGRYGDEAKAAAWELLRRGWVDYLSSDYHARGRLAVRAGRDALEAAGGAEQARLLMEVNPQRLLAGLPPEPVPPLAQRVPVWRRLLSLRG
jgi:protein-tyrosine phosphatase